MKVTVRQIAAAAEVSVGTVSRVLNGDPTVSRANAERVQGAVSSMNYRPLRRRIRREGSNELAGAKIGLLMLGMDKALTTLPVVASAVQGAEHAVAKAHGSLMLLSAPLLELPPVLLRERLDGLILKGALQGALSEAIDPRLKEYLRRVPSVWMLGRPLGFSGKAVGTHDWRVGQLAADHLASRGHRHVAFLNPKGDHLAFRARELSFVDRVSSYGGTVRTIVHRPERPVRFPLPPIREAVEINDLIEELLAMTPRPTAAFVPADNIASLVYVKLAERGLSVGRDLSLISCNNEAPRIMSLFPKLTTIDVHAEQIGKRAVEILGNILRGRCAADDFEVLLDPTLVEGQSVEWIA